jgi:hypothetical protein
VIHAIFQFPDKGILGYVKSPILYPKFDVMQVFKQERLLTGALTVRIDFVEINVPDVRTA